MFERVTIAYVISTLSAVGGLEKCVIDLVNNINPHIFSPIICILNKARDKISFNRNDIKIFEMNKKRGNDFCLPFRLCSLFKKEKVQIVHSANWSTYWESALAAKLARIPVAIHMEQGLEYQDVYMSPRKKRKRAYIRRLFSYGIDKIVTVSDELKTSLIQSTGITGNKFIRIPNCAHLNTLDPTVYRKMKRTEIGLNNEDIVVGTVGRLTKVKNYPCLIDAISSARRDIPEIRLVMIGDGPEMNYLIEMVKKNALDENVLFLGRRKDIYELLHVLDLFVLPSIFEGISISILEAMSAGLPVVATDVGGNPEIVADNRTGFLVPPSNPVALSKAIVNILKDTKKAKIMGQKGRQRIEKEFSLEKMIASYEELYLFYLRKKEGFPKAL